MISTERLCRGFESYCTGKKEDVMVKERIDNQRLFDFSLSERYIYTCIGDANEGEDCLPEIGIGEQRFET